MAAAVHVDDILLLAPSASHRSWFEQQLQKDFEITKQHDTLSYLGMTIQRTPSEVFVTQEKHIQDIVKKFGFDKLRNYPKTPANATLFEEDSTSPLTDKSAYLSVIMSLMYIGRFTRPDILMPTSYLATRSSSPTADDYAKALRIVKYLAGTPTYGISYKPSTSVVTRAYIDASHALHPSGHGHGGLLLTMGSGPLFARSFKLKSITRSSSETELAALDDGVTYVLWHRQLLSDLGYPQHEPSIICQDNKSTIIMAAQGGQFKRTKHMLVKHKFVQEHLHNQSIKLHYTPSKLMHADIMTKLHSSTSLVRNLTSIGIVRTK